MTPEQIAAKKAERAARAEARKAVIQKGGNGAMVASLEALADKLEEQDENLTSGQEGLSEKIKGMKADVEAVQAKLKTRAAGAQTEGMDEKKFNFGKLGKAYHTQIVDDSENGIGYELECLEQASKGFGRGTSKKDIISALTGGSGGNALPVQVSNQIAEAARSESKLFSLGVTNDSLEGLSSFAVPIEVTSANGVGDGVINVPNSQQEGGAVTTVRPGFRLANFTPRRMGMIIGMTEDYLKQGGAFVDAFVRRTASMDMRNQLERFALTGRGQQFSEPTGILKRTDLTTSSITLPTDGRGIAFSDLKDFEIDLAEANRLTDTCGFYTRPGVLRGLVKQVATYGLSGADATNSMPVTPMQFMSMKKLGEYCGYNLNWSTNIPANFTQGATTTASYCAFGDWSKVWIPFWGPMEFLMNNVATVGSVSAFENYLFYMRFVQMYDVNIVSPDAMIVKAGFKTTGF